MNFVKIEGVDFSKYGFSEVGGELVFSVYKAVKEPLWREFIKGNFKEFSELSYRAMQLDAALPKARKRKLSTFIKSIYDQENVLAATVMIKALHTLTTTPNFDEGEVVERIIKSILPNAGFKKKLSESGKYIWILDDKRKFKQGIGKAFVLNYINSNFDKDSVWSWLKKYCYRAADGTWVYKSDDSKGKIEQAIKSFLKDGGVIMELKDTGKEFQAYIPLTLQKDASGSGRFLLEKTIDGVKTFYVKGVASNTNVDRDEERMGEKFIASMKKDCIGLPLIVNTHSSKDLDETIGVIVKASGDAKTFEIEAKLESPEDNPNVKKALNKMELGVNFGFSVGGRVTKAFREYNKELDKEIVVLAEGQLHHVLLTNQPANPSTFAEAIAKSLGSKGDLKLEGDGKVQKMYEVKHRSTIHRSEPSEEIVMKSVSDLPDTAFPINHADKFCNKDYAHHFVDGGELFLHKSLLLKAYQKAVSSGAPKYVVSHLQNHLCTIGLSKMMEDVQGLVKSVDNMDEIQALSANIASELKELFKSVQSVRKLHTSATSRMAMLKNVIGDASTKISKLFETVDVEE